MAPPSARYPRYDRFDREFAAAGRCNPEMKSCSRSLLRELGSLPAVPTSSCRRWESASSIPEALFVDCARRWDYPAAAQSYTTLGEAVPNPDRKSTRLNSSHGYI